MRRQGPLTIRHMVVAALVMLVVNAQLTWWIIYTLRENRTRLRLERGKLEAACAAEVERVRSALAEARLALLTDLAGEPAAGRVAPPKPFVNRHPLLFVSDTLSVADGVALRSAERIVAGLRQHEAAAQLA